MSYKTDLQITQDLPEHRKMAYGRAHSAPWQGSQYACAIERHLSFTTRVAVWLRGLWS